MNDKILWELYYFNDSSIQEAIGHVEVAPNTLKEIFCIDSDGDDIYGISVDDHGFEHFEQFYYMDDLVFDSANEAIKLVEQSYNKNKFTPHTK